MVMWTALAWILTPVLAIKFGYLGVAYATAIIALSSGIPVIIVHRLTHFSISNSFAKPALATLVMLMPSLFITDIFFNLIVSLLLFTITIYFLVGNQLLVDVRRFYHVLVKKA